MGSVLVRGESQPVTFCQPARPLLLLGPGFLDGLHDLIKLQPLELRVPFLRARTFTQAEIGTVRDGRAVFIVAFKLVYLDVFAEQHETEE